MNYAKVLSLEFNMKEEYATNIISLIDEGCTIPFIARYRKELTNSCDDQVLRDFSDRLNYLRNLQKRKEEVCKLITEQEKMTDKLKKDIEDANTLTEVEDIYRPFRPKRQTRATIAVSKGLSPLAERILSQKDFEGDIEKIASEFINDEKGVKTIQDALNGASDIIAETVSDSADLRKNLREFLLRSSFIVTELQLNENYKTYQMYDCYKEEVFKIPSHRILAINRGENEKCLKVTLEINKVKCLEMIDALFKKNDNNIFSDLLKNAFEDSFNRLIMPSLEREIRNILTDKSNEQAIKMFEVNLEPLLMQPPLKDKVILGFDPAYRTGCKIAVIDKSGKVVDKTVVYPTPPHSEIEASEKILTNLIYKHDIDAIAIGNGTASKESEIFISNLIKKIDRKVEYMMVNEAGASVYSASKLGAQEFPDFDVSLRSAVSIARRLQDPLAELIKIDVKSIGVGQYQHDMPQKRLGDVLEGVVENCVNKVGVDLNTASPSLLFYVSGLNEGIAKNIIEYRNQNGMFSERKQLLKVSKLGGKAYEQCAGFLRIPNAKNVLDSTAVHPESYSKVKKLLELFNMSEKDVQNGNIESLPNLIKLKGASVVAKACDMGEPTLNDIVNELLKPGRDIRDELPKPMLRSDILDMKDLKPDMELMGTVRNVIDFGAFIDIGVHQDGLVHISEICNRYIKHPSEELTVGQIVKVKVLAVDLDKKRISLSIKRCENNE